MGPDRATEAIRKALSMGADKAVHLSDEALAGSDAVGDGAGAGQARSARRRASTWCWRATRRPTGGRRAVPAMVAEVLGLPALTHAREVTVEGGAVTVRRETDDGVSRCSRRAARGGRR